MNTFDIRKATSDDAPVIFELITELASYEKLLDQVEGSAEDLARHLAEGAVPRCEAFLAIDTSGRAVGFALYYWSYSTFLTGWGIYLEDLFVKEAHRGRGIGQQLLARVAHEAVSRGGSRLTWQVLDWNAPSIAFYQGLGARMLGEWEPMRLDGVALEQVASRYSGTI